MHLTNNIGTSLGCANGSPCTVLHVEFDPREVIDYNSTGPIRCKFMPKYIRIRVPKLARQIEGHGLNKVTIFPTTTTLTINEPGLSINIASQYKRRKGNILMIMLLM